MIICYCANFCDQLFTRQLLNTAKYFTSKTMKEISPDFSFITRHKYLSPLRREIPKASYYFSLINSLRPSLIHDEETVFLYSLSALVIANIDDFNSSKLVLTDILLLNNQNPNVKSFLVALSTSYTLLMHTKCLKSHVEIEIHRFISSFTALAAFYKDLQIRAEKSFDPVTQKNMSTTLLILTWTIFSYFYHTFNIDDIVLLNFLLVLSQSIAQASLSEEGLSWKQRYDIDSFSRDETYLNNSRRSLRIFRELFESVIQNVIAKTISAAKTSEGIAHFHNQLKKESSNTTFLNVFDIPCIAEAQLAGETIASQYDNALEDIMLQVTDKMSQTRLGKLNLSPTAISARKSDDALVNKYFFYLLRLVAEGNTALVPETREEGSMLMDACFIAAEALAARHQGNDFVVPNNQPSALLYYLNFIRTMLLDKNELPFWLCDSLSNVIFKISCEFSYRKERSFWKLKPSVRNEIIDVIDASVFTPFFELSSILLPISLSQNVRRLFRSLLQKSFSDKNVLVHLESSSALPLAVLCFYLSINTMLLCDKKYSELAPSFTLEKLIENTKKFNAPNELNEQEMLIWASPFSLLLRDSCLGFYRQAVDSLTSFEGNASTSMKREMSPRYRCNSESISCEADHAKIRRS